MLGPERLSDTCYDDGERAPRTVYTFMQTYHVI